MSNLPLVSVLTPTYGRPAFLRLAVDQFLAYSYPNKEMIIVDDTPPGLGDAYVPNVAGVKYIRLQERQILGEKHNTAAAAAQGEIFVQQDDDDIFDRRRLSIQLEKIVLGQTDITGLHVNFVLGLPEGRFFHFKEGVRFALAGDDHHLHFRFHDSTAAYRRQVWEKVRFTAIPAGEKASFLNRAIEAGFRQEMISNRDLFIYVRHRLNTWQYRDWAVHEPAAKPWWMSDAKLLAYRRAAA